MFLKGSSSCLVLRFRRVMRFVQNPPSVQSRPKGPVDIKLRFNTYGISQLHNTCCCEHSAMDLWPESDWDVDQTPRPTFHPSNPPQFSPLDSHTTHSHCSPPPLPISNCLAGHRPLRRACVDAPCRSNIGTAQNGIQYPYLLCMHMRAAFTLQTWWEKKNAAARSAAAASLGGLPCRGRAGCRLGSYLPYRLLCCYVLY